ncbi:unnamed protein product [Vitrella brassicaformis CCMP3155]|uniref:Pherophorin domain-containing protein n=1 Tax=Vitrella brassicaformis (strain CCMP3155) TaxID=1169540 RepID=A0A0G4FJS3_VITBC|nr:unnamed protein product [Vitrella brassicaformis CCMP3155]|eukprot:CEM14017.1 unnamed protein product [Vitrella brassicaformis CCMP3155]
MAWSSATLLVVTFAAVLAIRCGANRLPPSASSFRKAAPTDAGILAVKAPLEELSTMASIAKTSQGIKNESANITTAADEDREPNLGNAWLTETDNNPNLDVIRLLGFDSYRDLHGTLPPAAEMCVAKLGQELYKGTAELDAITLQNCLKSAGDNTTLHEGCMCREGVMRNPFSAANCCSGELLAFEASLAPLNANRTSVVSLQVSMESPCPPNTHTDELSAEHVSSVCV